MRKNRLFTIVILIITLLGCATGSVVVTGQRRPAIDPNEVTIYIEPPEKYETIGIVEASSEVEFSSQAARDRTINELKVQAAKIGANGVILLQTGESSSDSIGYTSGGVFYSSSTEIKTAEGKAIYVE